MNAWNKIRIAYVEDQPVVRRAVCNFLNTHPALKVVCDTDSGHELLSFLDNTIPTPNLCILDITIPKMDGISLLEKIRKSKKTWSKIPCLIYSMHNNQPTILQAIRFGVNGYISKNYGFDELLKAIFDIIDSGFAYTPDADPSLFEDVLNRKIEVPLLSEQLRVFIRYAGTELSYSEIAKAMKISDKTVETYRSRCFKRLNVTNRAGLTLQGIKLGIINI